jgi:hypothetical protein
MLHWMALKLGGTLSGLFDSSATFRKYTAVKLSFIGVGLLDLLLTVMAMNLDSVEHNPYIRFLVQIPVLLLAVKFFIPVFIAWLIPGKLLIPSLALLVLVVGWNIKELAILLI